MSYQLQVVQRAHLSLANWYGVKTSAQCHIVTPKQNNNSPTTGNQIAAATLLVKDVDVPQVHWAFWGPAMKTGKTAENSQN